MAKLHALSKAHAKWTQHEITVLQREWARVRTRSLRSKLPGRTMLAIRRKASELGMGTSQTQGLVPLTKIARTLGFSYAFTVKLLERAEVQIVRKHPSGWIKETKRKVWQRYVDPDEAKAVCDRWSREETSTIASARLGVSPWRLMRRARKLYHVRRGVPLRLLPEQWDEIARTVKR